jgi:metal-sulfur cluster biosynthetic enzyme/nitrite reductase/ring-hydroxylating ferredoxin subunit
MSAFERVAAIDELSPGERLTVFVDDVPVLLVQEEPGNYSAVEDVCSHDGQPLGDGPVANGEVTCTRHGARFDLKTGAPKCMPATEGVAVYEVRADSTGIYLRLNEHAAEINTTNDATTGDSTAESAPAENLDGLPVAATEGECCDGLVSTGESVCEEHSEEEQGERSVDEKMIDALRTVIDPELMINIVDLGLVYSVNHDGQRAYVDMTLTSPACPAGPQIVQQAKMSLERLRDVDEAEIKLVMTPPWSPDRMTDEARDHLGIF